jgi:Arc/MetJ family transcription regulator
MPSNLAIDDKLLQQAQRLGRHRTKREAVNVALREYVTRMKQRDVLDLANSLEWDPKYDYKAERQRSR